MKRSENRILTTHVGSLPRPKELLELAAVQQRARRRPKETVRRCGAVAEVVKQQADVGIDIVNDGEFGKSSWAGYILERISGFEMRPDQLRPSRVAGPRPRALPRISSRQEIPQRERPARRPRPASARWNIRDKASIGRWRWMPQGGVKPA